MTEQPNGGSTKVAPKAHTEMAYDSIKDGITSGVISPGEWLREYAVASSLGLSRTPVREALRALAAEGIVELEHNRGARVIAWTSEDIDEVYRLRALLEGFGATLAARHATTEANITAARRDLDRDRGRAGVDRVVDQLLDHRRRALDHLPGRDLIDHVRRQDRDHRFHLWIASTAV